MKTLTDDQITQLTKGIVKHCIIPQLSDIFECPMFQEFDKAAKTLTDSEEIIRAWLDGNLDKQIDKVYKDIETSIITHLKGCYDV